MKVLTLDTSLQGITLGLVELSGRSYTVVDHYGSPHPQEAAARLPELCLALLQRHGLKVGDVEALLVSHGPGSFTGIKIGLSFAAGWQQAKTPIRMYGVSSLQGLLRQLPEGRSLLLPATQTAGYLVTRVNAEVKVGVVDLALPHVFALVDEAAGTHSAFSPEGLGQVEILGAWPKVEAWLAEHGIAHSPHSSEDFHIRVVSGMVEDFIANSDKLSEGRLVPVYLRKSAPEEKLDNLAKSHKQD